ncbi:MAG TPA: CpXC domain-containing protein [Elusimicrobiota bacterium]|nr:CpXC domain-containing protein [Elusimicrobiota bacterium]
MSTCLEQDINCPCGEEFDARLWSSVNTQTDPALRDEILAGQLNVVKCPRCRRFIYAERFVLYHDPSVELMVFVYPAAYASEEERWRKKTEEDYKSVLGAVNEKERLPYGALSVFGLDRLVELLRREQAAADEEAVFESLAPSLSLQIGCLGSSVARENALPSRLPLSGDATDSPEDRLREGLRVLLAANDRLASYAAAAERLARRAFDPAGLLSGHSQKKGG